MYVIDMGIIMEIKDVDEAHRNQGGFGLSGITCGERL